MKEEILVWLVDGFVWLAIFTFFTWLTIKLMEQSYDLDKEGEVI